MEKYREIEKSIIKKYRKDIWSKFVKAIKNYDLISPNDKIAVCISGGKDSFLLAKCLEELKRHGIYKFDLEYIIMDPGYNSDVLEKIKANLKVFNIKAHIFKTEVFKISKDCDSPCYLCAKMRRGYLYHEALKLGCNKIALGHHFDDVIETVLLNQIFNGTYSTMMPKLKSDNFENIELIRPLYLIREKAIINWANYNDLSFSNCECPITKKDIGKRLVIKNLINDLNKIYSYADKNIFKSTENVNLDALLGYKLNNKKNSFLDKYGLQK